MSGGAPIAELVQLLSRLPGVGERTAQRLAFHVLGESPEYAGALGESLAGLHQRVKRCGRCGHYGSAELCDICLDTRRQDQVICVVARVQDLLAIERSSNFAGRYHVLHGLLAPLDGVGPDALPTAALRARIEQEGVREVILATPLSVDGEATALYLSSVLEGSGASVTLIASGIPHGGELEFTDQVTLDRAFEGRKPI